MALIDDIEFYGSRADAGDLERGEAARLLAEASNGGLTLVGAASAIADWRGTRERFQRQHADNVDLLRALQNGRPIPEHVRRHIREDALRMVRRDFLAD